MIAKRIARKYHRAKNKCKKLAEEIDINIKKEETEKFSEFYWKTLFE